MQWGWQRESLSLIPVFRKTLVKPHDYVTHDYTPLMKTRDPFRCARRHLLLRHDPGRLQRRLRRRLRRHAVSGGDHAEGQRLGRRPRHLEGTIKNLH